MEFNLEFRLIAVNIIEFLFWEKMDGENLKSKFKTFIDKTKHNTRSNNLNHGGSQEIMSSDNIALAAAERYIKDNSEAII